ncbi:hypothetical protein [Prosthecodimorpha hirschii]|jgi:hypothetical protein|uniref:hypothetical protein n=1 Tax=Prosthecodimorpha hirschii TaxID=665126 RepID=UPI00112B0FF6|nr:hypothetical protein [Prosthecomicrobium hirschii]
MLSYLSAENGFLKTFGNRCLILLFLAILVRTGGELGGKASALGISLDITQGAILSVSPILTLLFMTSLKLEADNLREARKAVTSDFENYKYRFGKNPVIWYFLFLFPAVESLFFTYQFVINLIPASETCAGFSRLRQLTDFSLLSGGPSMFCIGDRAEKMPWIYPPLQSHIYILCTAATGFIGYRIARDWPKFRGRI